MTQRRRRLIVLLAVLVFLPFAALELTYRVLLWSVSPLPDLGQPPAIPGHVSRSIWAVEVGPGEPSIRPLYPWMLHRYFEFSEKGPNLAWPVAREALVQARERGQVRGMGGWHVKGMALTMWVTRQLSTAEILSAYADSLWFPCDTRGMEAAATRFLGTPLYDVTPAQTALLLAVARRPKALDPMTSPTRAREARDRLLGQMAQFGAIDQAELPAALEEPLLWRDGCGESYTGGE
jgi:hypothetical protein